MIAVPAQDSRLEALHAQYRQAKEQAEEYKRKFDDLKAAITRELEDTYQGDDRPVKAYEIPASVYGPALTVYYKSSEYVPADTLRKLFPGIWSEFKQQTATYTEVRENSQGKPRRKK